MYQVNISEAKAQLTELIQKALAGEEVVVCNQNRPQVKLVPVAEMPPRVLGKKLLGDFEVPPEFFEPMTEEELAEWERPIDL